MTMVTFAMSEALRSKAIFPDMGADRWVMARTLAEGGGRREFFNASAEFERLARGMSKEMGEGHREVANWLAWNLPWGDCDERSEAAT